jgi:hypothetical protein
LPAKVVQTSEEKARDLATVPEADTTSRRSKRRAASADQDSGERAEKLKATRNLHAPCNNDNENTPTPSFLQLSNDDIISNMSDIGMVEGIDKIADSMLIETLKTVEKERWLDIIEQDKIERIFDKEQKEMDEEEEIDKLMLRSLCSDITDEVMSLDNAHPMDCGKIPNKKNIFFI